MSKRDTMQRSRGQLATAYAPHSLFTFEGGSGACLALPSPGNRAAGDELRPNTERMISEQIQEYFDAWAQRATRGTNLRHPVPLKLAVDGRVVSDDTVRVRFGDLAFQVPDHVGYVPFPLAFVCTRCKLHRHSNRVERLADEAARFSDACPSGGDNCANDWQQLDVVFAHWSGHVEALTPNYRSWHDGAVRELDRCVRV